ncbi:hypothetical protein GIB67_026368, partial [Kingdonia uniflora]
NKKKCSSPDDAVKPQNCLPACSTTLPYIPPTRALDLQNSLTHRNSKGTTSSFPSYSTLTYFTCSDLMVRPEVDVSISIEVSIPIINLRMRFIQIFYTLDLHTYRSRYSIIIFLSIHIHAHIYHTYIMHIRLLCIYLFLHK